MIYSHFLDLLGKMFSSVVTILLLIHFNLMDTLNTYLLKTENPEFYRFVAFLLIFASVFFFIHHPFIDVLITKLYTGIKFKVWPDWQESRELRKLFCLNKKMKWSPMDHVLQEPAEERLGILLEAAQSIGMKDIAVEDEKS